MPTIVLTHQDLPAHRENVKLYAGDLNTLVDDRMKPDYKNIWLVGGATLARDFVRLKLADELRLSIMPVILGEGTRFLDSLGQEQALHLKNVTAFKNGAVELWYEITQNRSLSEQR